MKVKKVLFGVIIATVLIILVGIGYMFMNRPQEDYIELSKQRKEEIKVVMNDCRDEMLILNTSSSQISWIEEAIVQQEQMMDKVLDSISILGEIKTGMPTRYIKATFGTKMRLYIVHGKEKETYKLVLEINDHYYAAKAKQEDVKAVVDYMKDQLISW